jgi:pyruvate/2-oxoglutarate dehydrogenase complex dihydrolipoamide acyltransferase (E2) component
METEIRLPQLSMAATEAAVVRWLVSEGDRVEVGDILVDVETAKVEVGVESPFEGWIVRIIAQVDDVIGAQDVLAVVNRV